MLLLEGEPANESLFEERYLIGVPQHLNNRRKVPERTFTNLTDSKLQPSGTHLWECERESRASMYQ